MSGPRLYRDYLDDMLDAAEKAENFLGDLAFDDFTGNAEKVFAIIRARWKLSAKRPSRFQKPYAPNTPKFPGVALLGCGMC